MDRNPLGHLTGNRLIDHLPQADASRLVAAGKYTALQQGDIVQRQDRPTTDVYFPRRGCCCHIVTLDEGRRVETTTIGNEGMVGFHLTLGLDWSPLTAVALVPGEALRVPTAAFLDVMKDSEVLGTLSGGTPLSAFDMRAKLSPAMLCTRSSNVLAGEC